MKTSVKRLIALVFAVVLCVSSFASCGGAAEDSGVLELNVYNAEEYISEFDAEWETFDIIKKFEEVATEKFGKKVKVNYSTFGTIENMYNELQLTKKKGKNGEYTYAYDLVCPSDYMIQRMINENMLETYDASENQDGEIVYDKVDNYNGYASGFIKDLFNSKEEENYVTGSVKKWAEYAVCYMWGTMGFIYNPVKLAETNADIDINGLLKDGEIALTGNELEEYVKANTWSLPWQAYYKNLGTIKDSIRDTYALAVGKVYGEKLLELRRLWESGELTHDEYQKIIIKVFNNVNTPLSEEFATLGLPADKLTLLAKIFPDTETKTVDIVSESLKDLKHNVYGFEVDSGKKDMAAGKIAINFAWSGDAAYTLDTADEYSDGAQLYYSVPKEGSNIWFDAWVMLKGANKELAQFFVNFISSPECAISNMDYIGYVSPISGDEVFERLLDTYELTTDPAEAEANGLTYAIDYSYYFTNISDDYKTEDGKVIVYSAPENIGRQLTTQYPEKSTVDRCALMTTLSKGELKDLNKMWSDVKVGDISTAFLITVPVIIGVVLLFFAVYSILKKRGITFKRKPKVYGQLLKSERIR